MKTKIKNIALRTDSLSTSMYDFILGKTPEIDYVFTSIEDNNDYLIGPKRGNKKIITTLKSVREWKNLLPYHLECLKVSAVEALLLPPQGLEEMGEYLEELKEIPKVIKNLGLINPTLEELKSLEGLLEVKYISKDLSPLTYDKELEDYCDLHGISIISTGIFGRNPWKMKFQWTPEFLLLFAASHSDIVSIPSEGFEQSLYYSEFLKGLQGKELSEEERKLICLSKSTNYDHEKLLRSIHIYYKIKEDLLDLGEVSEFINSDSTVFSLKGLPEHIEETIRLSPLSQEIHQTLRTVLENSQIESEKELQAYSRYIVSGILSGKLSRVKGIKFNYDKIGNLFIIKVRHKILWWIKKTYLLSVRLLEDNSYRIYFTEEKD